jgi:hypothetical protein
MSPKEESASAIGEDDRFLVTGSVSMEESSKAPVTSCGVVFRGPDIGGVWGPVGSGLDMGEGNRPGH